MRPRWRRALLGTFRTYALGRLPGCGTESHRPNLYWNCDAPASGPANGGGGLWSMIGRAALLPAGNCRSARFYWRSLGDCASLGNSIT